MTLTGQTKQQYEQRAISLFTRYVKEVRSLASDGLEKGCASGIETMGNEFCEWLVSLRPGIARSTWRQYKSAVVYYLEHIGQEDAAGWLRFHGTEGCVKRTSRTSGKKAKKISDDELVLLLNILQQGRGKNDVAVGLWLVGGVLTGLRPVEWKDASLRGRELVVANAKNSNGRTHGLTRTLHLECLSDRKLEAIALFLEKVRQQSDFRAFYCSCRNRLRVVVRQLWPRRDRYPSLYSARHQFAANAKCSGLDCAQIAALMGHASQETATMHYGRKQVGCGGRTPLADSGDVERVRKMNVGRPALFRRSRGLFPAPTF